MLRLEHVGTDSFTVKWNTDNPGTCRSETLDRLQEGWFFNDDRISWGKKNSGCKINSLHRAGKNHYFFCGCRNTTKFHQLAQTFSKRVVPFNGAEIKHIIIKSIFILNGLQLVNRVQIRITHTGSERDHVMPG